MGKPKKTQHLPGWLLFERVGTWWVHHAGNLDYTKKYGSLNPQKIQVSHPIPVPDRRKDVLGTNPILRIGCFRCNFSSEKDIQKRILSGTKTPSYTSGSQNNEGTDSGKKRDPTRTLIPDSSIPRDPGSPKLRMVIEPTYLAFRRLLYTPCTSYDFRWLDP